MRKIIALVLTASLSFVGIGFAQAANPKAGTKCSTANQKVTFSGKTFTCVKKGKSLVWDAGVPVAKQAASKNVTEGFLCAEGSAPAKDTNGSTLYCTKGGDGKSSWRPQSQQSSGGGANTQNTGFKLGQLGASCSKNSEIAWNGLMAAICKNGKVSYLLAADAPKTPAGGFTSRPEWYPTLSQILGGSGATEPTCAPSSILFTSPVLPLDQLAPAIPYGAMIGGHVTPIDHAYLGVKALSKPASQLTASDYVPVTAPAAGTITEVSNLGSPNSYRVVIDHGCNLYSVYMVMNKVTGVLASLAAQAATSGYLKANVKVKAGDEFGRQAETALDFNVFDGTQWLSGFQNIQSYLTQDTWKPYTADYLPFFTPSIRTAMEAQLQKTSSPRVGKIDHDIAGTASGNWFLAGTNGYAGRLNSDYENARAMLGSGTVPGKNDYSWSHLAIAPHQVDTKAWVFSSGWWKDPNGDADQAALIVGSGQVTPDKLTSASGMVVYKLAQLSYTPPAGVTPNPSGSMAPWPIGYTVTTGMSRGVVALQVNADGSLSLELNTTLTDPASLTAFTAAKRIYNR
ncbi:unannotated protein [freshwater metagenome]|uniref:Unannotated protein n=1 Tax=freshwater metagenome TaxID=449393 RepID=A0A6J6BFU5_9ZZZZ|nr:hypothetical protein [Actinomycetota bacterium]